MVVVRVELPVQEVLGGDDLKGVTEDGGSAMRRRTQLDDVRTERHGLVVAVLRPVIECYLYAHPSPCGSRLDFVLASPVLTSREARVLGITTSVKLPYLRGLWRAIF